MGHHPTSSNESLIPYGESAAYKHSRERKSVDLSGLQKPRADDVVNKFEVKLNEVNKGYLAFFQERIHIEEQYVDSLQRLYAKSRAFDSLYDDGIPGPLPTSRQAWREVRDHTEREADTRLAFIHALQDSVVRLMTDVATVQGRIRTRIKEDLKVATDMYIEQAETTLPKLKKSYFKKVQELEDQKRQESAIALQQKLLSDPVQHDRSYSPLASPNNESSNNPYAYASPPNMTGPLPPSSNPALINANLVHSFENTEGQGGRKRSGSMGQDKSKEIFNDLAQQGKRFTNNLISRFGGDKDNKSGGGVGEDTVISGPVGGIAAPTPVLAPTGQGHLRNPSAYGGRVGEGLPVKAAAMKSVKLKREADEADKAYRQAVFHLESLRLRRNKIQTAATESYEEFTVELCVLLKSCLKAYVDCSSATAATNAQMVEHPRKSIELMDAMRDVASFSGPPHMKALNFAAPVMYENYYVGPCKSLIFGVSLNDYDYQRGEKHVGEPPLIVLKCIAELDQRALETEGIHRISGRQASIQTLVHEIEQDEKAFRFTNQHDVSAVSAVLKLYCRELTEPIFPFPHAERMRYTENRESHIGSNFSAIRARLHRLPEIHQSTLRVIIEHLSRVASQSTINKMDAKNLAVVFGKAIFGEDELPKNIDLTTYKPGKDTVAEDMINYAPLLFSAEEDTNAPVLPAGSALTRSGSLSYRQPSTGVGSQHTRAKLPKLGTRKQSSSSESQFSPPNHPPPSINLNDDHSSPASASSSKPPLPPGAATPEEVEVPNPNLEFRPPPLPPRPNDVGSVHSRKPSANHGSTQPGELGAILGIPVPEPSPGGLSAASIEAVDSASDAEQEGFVKVNVVGLDKGKEREELPAYSDSPRDYTPVDAKKEGGEVQGREEGVDGSGGEKGNTI